MGVSGSMSVEVGASKLDERHGNSVLGYLDRLAEEQRREHAGVRDRFSIPAESEIELRAAVREGAVVLFCLDADRRPLLSQMLAAAIVSDLVTLVADLQAEPTATVVVIDEFAAIAATHISRLFSRARSAGLSLVLGTQELADLKTAGDGLREQVLGNVETVIAHRQNVPESAELIAGIAGTRPVWITTHQTDTGLLTGAGPSGRGSRRRGYEYALHPGRIKALGVGEAAVIAPGAETPATVARMLHPVGISTNGARRATA